MTLLSDVIDPTIASLHRDIAHELPHASAAVQAWITAVTRGTGLASYFTHPIAFPSLALPIWYETATKNTADRALHTALVDSTMAGYLAIRLIDDVMDGSTAARRDLLPVTAWLFHRFEAPYHRWFPAEHPFWREFRATWSASADVTAAEPSLTTWTEAVFETVSAGKIGAAWIPVVAIAWRRGGASPSAAWRQLCWRMFAWHQLHNDLFDWARDHAAGQRTWVQAEAAASGSPMVVYMASGGLARGFARLRAWGEDIRERAEREHAHDLSRWIEGRLARLADEGPSLESALAALQSVAARVPA